jgi:hypothetical protein
MYSTLNSFRLPLIEQLMLNQCRQSCPDLYAGRFQDFIGHINHGDLTTTLRQHHGDAVSHDARTDDGSSVYQHVLSLSQIH